MLSAVPKIGKNLIEYRRFTILCSVLVKCVMPKRQLTTPHAHILEMASFWGIFGQFFCHPKHPSVLAHRSAFTASQGHLRPHLVQTWTVRRGNQRDGQTGIAV